MALYRPPAMYYCGAVVGFGSGIFLASLFGDYGSFPMGGTAWTVIKLAGLFLMIAGCVWLMRLGNTTKLEKNP